MRVGARIVLVAVLALGLGPGCASLAVLPELDWNPLIRVEHQAGGAREGGATEIEALGPLLDLRIGPEGVSHAVRPLYMSRTDGSRRVTHVLPPFGRFTTEPRVSTFRLWPLIWSGERRTEVHGDRWQVMAFPLIFAGNGPEDGDGYFAFFPIAGRTKRLFGVDTFDFFLWPLFMRTRMDVTEDSTSWTVLLLGGWTTGGPRDGSWRILPFYRRRLVRHADGTPRTDQHTVLWPFFTWGTDHEDTDSPSERSGFWPFYSREDSATWTRRTYLWPFFRFNRQTDPPVDEGGDFFTDAPFPFYRHWKDGTEQETGLWAWPAYMRRDAPDARSRVYAWPFVWDRSWTQREVEDDGWPPVGSETDALDVIPFWHGQETRLARDGDGPGSVARNTQFWPFVHAERGPGAHVDRALLSLMPFRHTELLRPADELYSFLWTLSRHRANETAVEHRSLFDTTLHRRSDEGLRVSIPFLYGRRPEPDGLDRHQLLWGLVTWRTDTAGLARLGLAGVDLWHR